MYVTYADGKTIGEYMYITNKINPLKNYIYMCVTDIIN
jgi:hypothetical protein